MIPVYSWCPVLILILKINLFAVKNSAMSVGLKLRFVSLEFLFKNIIRL